MITGEIKMMVELMKPTPKDVVIIRSIHYY